MIVKEIGALCRKAKQISLINKDGKQFVGTGYAFYLVEGIQNLDMDALTVVFDVPPKQLVDYKYETIDNLSFNLDDSRDGDAYVEIHPMQIKYEGKEYQPLIGGEEVVFINPKLLKPLQLYINADQLELYIRKSGTINVIVAKSGMFLRAVIYPLKPHAKLFSAVKEIIPIIEPPN